jgi:hypothetical protein
VSVSKKLFFAAAIVAAGYGVAALCGKPNVANMLVALPAYHSGWQPPAAESLPPPGFSESPFASTHEVARLVPDVTAGSKPHANAAPILSPSLEKKPFMTAPTLTAVDDLYSEKAGPTYSLDTEARTIAEPRARLRKEAPRPVGFGPRASAPITRAAPFNTPPNNLDVSPASNYTQPVADSSTPAVSAFSDFSPVESRATATRLTPLPPPSPVEEVEPRTHIVVDGDSLAKLAGRYLDDPRRAEEILEFNRGVLSNPDLLPIGTELVIPPRSPQPTVGAGAPQSYLPRAVAVHSAHGSGLVPVRPVPAASTLTPRARLVYPRAAE